MPGGRVHGLENDDLCKGDSIELSQKREKHNSETKIPPPEKPGGYPVDDEIIAQWMDQNQHNPAISHRLQCADTHRRRVQNRFDEFFRRIVVP